MSAQVTLVFVLTFVIHLIGTLGYALRIAGVRTGRIAVSLALVNVLLLVSRTSHTFQAPLLAKHVEQNILRGTPSGLEADFRWLLLASSLATIAGVLLIPTFQRLFTGAIYAFGEHRSIPRLLLSGFSRAGLRQIQNAATIPAKENITQLTLRGIPHRILIFNALAVALLAVGVFASLYAGYFRPDLRVTANNLSPVVNGFSTILLIVFIDPYLSLLTDDVVAGRATTGYFRRCVVLFGVSRFAGTVIAQVILVPAARVIVIIAEAL